MAAGKGQIEEAVFRAANRAPRRHVRMVRLVFSAFLFANDRQTGTDWHVYGTSQVLLHRVSCCNTIKDPKSVLE